MRRTLRYGILLLLLLQLAACGMTITVPSTAGNATPQASTSAGGSATQVPETPIKTGGGSQTDQLAQQLLRQINHDRAANNLPAYNWEPRLVRSAYQHNLVMAGGCGMQHNCPNEPQLGARESNQGVRWSYAGENIGMGGPVQASYESRWSMVSQLHNAMMGERPPEDGHRQNLLSQNFHRVGISIYVDAKNTLWLTEDFAD